MLSDVHEFQPRIILFGALLYYVETALMLCSYHWRISECVQPYVLTPCIIEQYVYMVRMMISRAHINIVVCGRVAWVGWVGGRLGE